MSKITTQLVYGKVPPYDLDMEKNILGSLMMHKDAYDMVVEVLNKDCFYTDGHQHIFEAIQTLQKNNSPVDILTVCDELRKTEKLDLVGGSYYITTLTNSFIGLHSIPKYCHLVYEKYLTREIIRIGGEMVSNGYEDTIDAFDLLDKLEKSVQELSLKRQASSVQPIDTVLVERLKRIHELQKQDSNITGIPSGYNMLDRITHGWQPTDLIILAARPSVGKTAFALNLARNATKTVSHHGKKRKVLIFSLEMSTGQLVDRILAAESEIPLDSIMTGKMPEMSLSVLYKKGAQPLSSSGIFIDDSPALNVYELRSKARYTIKKYGGFDTEWLIIIDYLQLMSGVEERKINNREQEISNISRNLKKLAKDLELPIIALSQLSRNVEQRRGEKQVPVLSDLRDSGAIEQDADTVMFLYRPEYYDITATEQGESTHGLTEISIAKHRHGSLAKGSDAIQLRALLHIQKFIPWEGNINTPVENNQNWRPVTSSDNKDLTFD